MQVFDHHLRSYYALALCVISIVGCGETDFVPVEGTVTLNQEPLDGALVTFEPVEGTAHQTASGTTDEKGHYQLYRAGRAGAYVGKNRVMITTIAPDAVQDERSALPHDLVPADYQDGSLTFDVPAEGTLEANFDLIGPRRLRR